MRKKKKSLFLLTITLLFLILGVFVVIFSARETISSYICLYNTRIVKNNEMFELEDQVCRCSNGKVTCVKKDGDKSQIFGDEIKEFTQKNLVYKSEYLTNIVSTEIDGLPLKTKFTSIDSSDGQIRISINSVQMCKKDLTIPPQYGMYRFENNQLILQNNVNTVSSIFSTPCVVKVIYQIKNLPIDIENGVELLFTDQSGYYTTADVCVYNSKLYNQGDKYYALDKCNICTCSDGLTKCTENKCSVPN